MARSAVSSTGAHTVQPVPMMTGGGVDPDDDPDDDPELEELELDDDVAAGGT